MAGRDTILKLIATVLFLLILPFITAIGYSLLDPIFNSVIDTGLMTDLGWGAPQNVVMLFVGLGLAGLGLAVVLWWIASPIRDDVRQEQRPPF